MWKVFVDSDKLELLSLRNMHFKDKLYFVQDLVTHAETGETLVIYQALYAPYHTYARPLESFLATIDSDRLDNSTNQKYRFELYTD